MIPLPTRESLLNLYKDVLLTVNDSTKKNEEENIPSSTEKQQQEQQEQDPIKKTNEVLATFHNDRRGLLLCMLSEKYGVSKLLEHKVLQIHQLVVNRNSLLSY